MDENFLIDTLKKSKEQKEIIGVWQYNDTDNFIAGYVLDLNDTFFTFQHLTKYGKLDGIILDKIETIQSVDFNDDYSKAMQYIFENSEKLDTEEVVKIDLNEKEDWQIDILEQFKGNTKQFISLEINGNENFTGFIEKLSKSDIVFHCVGKMGEDEGTVIYRNEDITAFRINDIDNRKRKMLFDWRKSSL
jgi:hypothetical protein